MNGDPSAEELSLMKPEHEALLNKAISEGDVEDWDDFKEVLKSRISANVAEYSTRGSDPLIERSNLPATQDGLVIPPFPPRINNPPVGPTRTLPTEMTDAEASEALESIISLIDGFTEGPPFTVKRISELALLPRNHYRTVGKYLRGVERTLLVTSSPTTFDLEDVVSPPSVYAALGMEGVLTTVTTPIFTPIPFLHEDARRRSQSRSPPASPLRLHNALSVGDAPADEPKGLGLVDELDTPAPGHMASKPQPLSATTSSEPPAHHETPSLADRFVKSEGDEAGEKAEEGEAKSSAGTEGKKGQEKEREEGKEDAEVENMVLTSDEEPHS